MALDITKIIQYPLATNQYFAQDCTALKNMIFIHHTAGNANPFLVVDGWNNDAARVGTPFVIGGKAVANSQKKWEDGDIIQCFSSKYYDFHLGLKASNNTAIAKATIGIEICNWGPLALHDGKYYTYVGTIIEDCDVEHYPNGFKAYPNSTFFTKIGVVNKPAIYYHKYTDNQILSLRDLLIYLCERYNITKAYNADMWDINSFALKGDPGIWTHVSVRLDKSDCHPQENLISMLEQLPYNSI